MGIEAHNLIPMCVYFATRKCIDQTWLNNQDQFSSPNQLWENDIGFKNNCFTYTLFHGKNNITSAESPNHWIPFTEGEVRARQAFASHFMTDFISGKLGARGVAPGAARQPSQLTIAIEDESSAGRFVPTRPLVFSEAARAVFTAGRALWRYHHTQLGANPDASYYDIREHFQGRNAKGRMNAASQDTRYTELLAALRDAMGRLARAIEPKVYEYEFSI